MKNTIVRYDMEEHFKINDELANDINYMVYKGIKIRYIFDTNTIIYRNYTKDDLKHYIDTELKDFIESEED